MNIAARIKFLSGTEIHVCAARVSALLLVMCLGALQGTAQTHRIVHHFNGLDGSNPEAGPAVSGTTLYGTTCNGGWENYGVVFKVSTDGTGYTVLREFTQADGVWPCGGLVLDGTTLYGTTESGGIANGGTVFKVSTDGTGFSVLKDLGGSDGANPVAGLVLSGGKLYGTTSEGGNIGWGTVFTLDASGSGFSVLKHFAGSDGANPLARLAVSGTTLYGTISAGGLGGGGALFRLNTDGTGYSTLESLDRSEGARPLAGLLFSGGDVYGTAYAGGSFECGTVFRICATGGPCTVLKHFCGTDGAQPHGGLVGSGATLYGATGAGGNAAAGTVFKVNTVTRAFKVLKQFTAADGEHPVGDLVLSGTTLYGTTFYGGDFNCGVVFALSLLDIQAGPQTQTAEAGSTVRLPVRATGDSPLAYRWVFNGTNVLTDATSPVLELVNVQPAQAGVYTVIVSNEAGAITNPPAMLSIIAPVERRQVPTLTLMGQPGDSLNLDFSAAADPSANWATIATVDLTNNSQLYFDLSAPLPAQGFYRAWQAGPGGQSPILNLRMVPAITLTGAVGSSVRLDYINQFGPTDAWVTLDTVTRTNTTELYYDLTAFGQPARLYRLVPLP